MASVFPSGANSPSAAAMQSNGDIVVAGTASASIDSAEVVMLARFLPTGKLDTTFGTNGVVSTTIPANPHFTTGLPDISSVLVQPNGDIVVGGLVGSCCKTTPGAAVLIRYTSAGVLDTTFGTSGISEVSPAITAPTALAELSNGEYLYVGPTGLVVELSSVGALESTQTTSSLLASSQAGSILFQSNGDFVVVQTVSAGRRATDAQVSRFSETGVADSTFNSTKFEIGGSNETQPQAIALQSNGDIVVAGLTNANGTPVVGGLARLLTNGQLDTTFGTGGSLKVPFAVAGVLVQSDGNIVVVGNNGNLALARYLSN